MDESNVPNSLLPHLNEIAERLWSGHAAIMVGAGFSKNAKATDDTAKDFPDWSMLGELFYKKARGEKLGGEKFLNPLKLADEVEASFDRPTLHRLLEDSIPDKEYEPSDLHVKLLNLPWSDVFTTNYDTLLERATKSVSDYSYQTVVNTEGLVYSKSSRIIKLHGSFPDTKPFIITEEDYRRYPSDFAPFVNTVQQSLLENTLLLVGFSGDDPNFLRWIGWIRDNLGEGNSPKIYIIGILNLTKAQELLFLRNNIVPIDMSEFDVISNNDYYKALDKFFDYCLCKKGETDRLDWPRSKELKGPERGLVDVSTGKNKELEEKEKIEQGMQQAELVVSHWKELRAQYPGWVIVPEDRRNGLWSSTRSWDTYPELSSGFSEISRLSFLYEYFWRVEKCLLPIFDDQVEVIKIAIDDFYPILNGVKDFSEAMLLDMDRFNIRQQEVQEMVTYLVLALLRYYREEGRLNEWEELGGRAEKVVSTREDQSRLFYETALFHLFKFDIEEVKAVLSNWDVNRSMPFWLSKKAGLMAEVGFLEKAVDMLEEALSEVRSKQNLKPITLDYSLVSQESYILVLLQYVNNGKAWAEKYSRSSSDYSDSWNKLKQYKCDPWNELKLLERSLDGEPLSKESDDSEYQFDIGRKSTAMYFGSYNEASLEAFRLLKFYEDAGIPHRIPGAFFSSDSLKGVFKRLYKYAPSWMLSTMLRAGNKDLVPYVLSRQSLLKMKFSDVNSLLKNYIAIYEKESLKQQSSDTHHKKILDYSMPEVLSRLCTKSSFELREKLLDLILDVYSSNHSIEADGFDRLVRRLMGGLSESEFLRMLPSFAKFPVLDEDGYRREHNLVNPCRFTTHLNPEYLKKKLKTPVSNKKIIELIRYVKDGTGGERGWATTTLREFKRLGFLNHNQSRQFSEALWSKLGNDGFPVDTNYLKFALCDDLVINPLQAQQMLREYILNSELPVQSRIVEKGISITGNSFILCNEIAGSSEYLNWDEAEIAKIIDKLVECWDSDQIYLSPDRSSGIRQEFHKRFRSVQHAIIFLLFHHKHKLSGKSISSLEKMILEMEEYGLPTARLASSFSTLLTDNKYNRAQGIRRGFLSNDVGFTSDAVNAIYDLLYGRISSEQSNIDLILNLFCETLQYRDEFRLEHVLWALIEILNGCPEFFNVDLEGSVVFCLEKLIEETSGAEMTFSFSKALSVREVAAQLSYALYCYYVKNDTEVPEVIFRWKAICESESEFLEIRKGWDF